MPRPFRYLSWVLILTISLYVNLASPAPFHAGQTRASFSRSLKKRQQTTPLIVQANSWTNDHSPALSGKDNSETPSTLALPPVSDIFKHLASPNQAPAPQVNPQQPVNPPPANNPPPPANNPPPVQNPPPVVHNPPPPAQNPPLAVHDPPPPVQNPPLIVHNPPPAQHPPPVAQPAPTSAHPVHAGPSHAASPEAGAKDHIADPEHSSLESSAAEGDHRKNLAPVGKLILIALVMAGIITLIFCIYFLVDRRALACCCRRRRRAHRNKGQHRLDDGAEQEPKDVTTPPPPWVKFSPPSPQDQTFSFEQNQSALPPRIVHPMHNQAINIAPGSPPSRRAVTANPYPFAARGASFSSTTMPMPQAVPLPPSPLSRAPRSPLPAVPIPDPPVPEFRRTRRSSTPAPLLPPNEFFFMPSASDMTLHAHSRVKSNPIFGHVIARCLPDIKLRSGEHRKSKSVSGLVYVVNTENGGKEREDVGYGKRSEAHPPF